MHDTLLASFSIVGVDCSGCVCVAVNAGTSCVW